MIMAVTFKKGRALGALSLTPLIDVVFLLLIFFLVATRFAEEEREMDVVLPEASEAQPLIAEPKQLFVNVDRDGRYFVAGNELNAGQLEQALYQAWTNNPTRQEVIIRGDKRAAWQHIALAMNACNKANIRNYKVATAE
jgi:biopolymer transport protein ExbD